MKVLITGAAGQLGTDLARHCAELNDEIVALSRADLDIADASAVAAALSASTPEIVVNCAAWTAVDACEADPQRAQRINADAVETLAEISEGLGAHLVQVSTDYVFDGSKTAPYNELDTPNPKSVYGSSKLAGEMAAGPDATIVRTSWLCSGHGSNMVATVLRLARTHPTLRFVADQRGRPTFTADLAAALRSLGERRHTGVFHVANHGPVSWFEFAQQVLRSAGQDPTRVEPIATADLDPPRPAPRPANSVLDTAKYEGLGLSELRPWVDALDDVLPEYQP